MKLTYKIILSGIVVLFPLFAASGAQEAGGKALKSNTGAEFDVAAIIWPAYQNAPRWKELGIFDHGNGEWQNVYQARPKFPGHNEPRVPLWGYGRDDDPVEMSRQIDAALAAGINVFIYDWYWYGGRPFLENALNNGFLKAPNNERMKFFLMWANHDVDGLWNSKLPLPEKWKVIWPAAVSAREFKQSLVPRFIEYFKKPNHYKIDGKPVFSIYRFPAFVAGAGGEAAAKEALEYLDAQCKKAGFKGVYLIVFGELGGGVKSAGLKGRRAVMDYYNIAAATTYNWNYMTWANIQKDKLDYDRWFALAKNVWNKMREETCGNFYPNVTIGWDTNSRYLPDTTTAYVSGSNPKKFKAALLEARDWALKNCKGPRLITINSWNEWTEGSYLMPDTQFGYGYLNACAEVFNSER